MPALASAQGTVTPGLSGGTVPPGASRSAILRQFADDPDVRAQREAYENKKVERETERQQRWREQDEQTRREQDRQTSRFYCAAPAHRDEAECR